jgi:hypothetical protein
MLTRAIQLAVGGDRGRRRTLTQNPVYRRPSAVPLIGGWEEEEDDEAPPGFTIEDKATLRPENDSEDIEGPGAPPPGFAGAGESIHRGEDGGPGGDETPPLDVSFA